MNTEIDRLLKASMQAHESARLARRSKTANAGALLAEARRLRTEALALDPERKDDAWQVEVSRLGKDLHDSLMAFYEKKA